MLAPVPVTPDTVSKNASAILSTAPDKIKGREPNREKHIQHKETTMIPSRFPNVLRSVLGYWKKSILPMTAAIPIVIRNAVVSFSP